MKECTKCGIEKSLDMFNKDSGSIDGHRTNCRDCGKEYNKAHYKRNKKSISARKRAYGDDYKKACSERAVKWQRDNPEKVLAKVAKRRATKLNATTPWTTKEQERDAFKSARIAGEMMGETTHLDHIIPLVNDKVCGLHCADNWQVLTESENCSKSNKWDGTHNNTQWRDDNG